MPDYIITYVLMLFCYSFFFVVVSTGARSGSGQLKDVLAGRGKLDVLYIRLIAGICFLGTATSLPFQQRGLDASMLHFGWNWNLIVSALMAAAFIIGISSALKKSDQNNSFHSLPIYLPLLFVFLRTLFLIVYEFFFRGAMLFIMIEDMGVVLAILFNVVFYALVHWFNKRERYGSVVMGLVLCAVTIYCHSVWPAIVIHLSLALSHEITLLIKNRALIKKSWL